MLAFFKMLTVSADDMYKTSLESLGAFVYVSDATFYKIQRCFAYNFFADGPSDVLAYSALIDFCNYLAFYKIVFFTEIISLFQTYL